MTSNGAKSIIIFLDLHKTKIPVNDVKVGDKTLPAVGSMKVLLLSLSLLLNIASPRKERTFQSRKETEHVQNDLCLFIIHTVGSFRRMNGIALE